MRRGRRMQRKLDHLKNKVDFLTFEKCKKFGTKSL